MVFSSTYLLPSLLGLAFLVVIFIFLFKSFRVPGAFFIGGLTTGLASTLGLFFALGSKLSLIGVIALITGFFYALLLSYFILSFLKKLFEIEFLDKDNIYVIFKRGLLFSSDITLPLFTLSTLIAFLAPLHLREFGIVLSLSILIFFPVISLLSNRLSLLYVHNNFLRVSNFLRAIPNREEKFFSTWSNKSFSNGFLIKSLTILTLLFLLSLLLYSFKGLNSFSIFKENYLITFTLDSNSLTSGKNITDVTKELTDEKIIGSIPNANVIPLGKSGNTISYLVESSFNDSQLKDLLSRNLKNSSYYIQSTNAFNEELTAYDLSKLILFALLFISIYVLIRFRFTNLLILLVDTFLSLATILSLITLLRISLYSGIFTGICVFFAASIMYHIYFFSIEKLNNFEWFLRISPDISNSVFRLMRNSMLIFLVLSLFTTNESIILLNVYTSISLLSVHYLCSLFYFLFKERIEAFKEAYMWKRDSSGEEEDGITNLDMYDEEIILGINKSF